MGVGVGAGTRGAAGGALAGHVHYAQWQELASLVRDGVAFCQRGGAGGGGYERVGGGRGKGKGKGKRGGHRSTRGGA